MSTRQDMVENSINNFWNVRDDLKDKSLPELQAVVQSDRLPYAVCAVNVSGDLNIGMMMRASSLLGAERFILFGSKKFDRRSTVGAQNYIDLIKVDAKKDPHSLELDYDLLTPTLKEYGYYPVFCDTGGMDSSVFFDLFELDHYEGKPCLVFGNEGMGLPTSLTKDQMIVTIPQRGVLRSLNVSSAASIFMYEMMKKFV